MAERPTAVAIGVACAEVAAAIAAIVALAVSCSAMNQADRANQLATEANQIGASANAVASQALELQSGQASADAAADADSVSTKITTAESEGGAERVTMTIVNGSRRPLHEAFLYWTPQGSSVEQSYEIGEVARCRQVDAIYDVEGVRAGGTEVVWLQWVDLDGNRWIRSSSEAHARILKGAIPEPSGEAVPNSNKQTYSTTEGQCK